MENSLPSPGRSGSSRMNDEWVWSIGDRGSASGGRLPHCSGRITL
jgi:hypothetical protein